MNAPIRTPADAGLVFPKPASVVADDARRFRRLSARDRWREIFALRGWGRRLSATADRRAVIARLETEQEARWQAAHRELFARHGH
jgi:hypothetical protein